MEAYTDFASVYDTFMDETPYEEWAAYLDACIREYGITEPYAANETGEAGTQDGEDAALKEERNLVLDLGCGTGTLTRLMAKAGYDMIGVDNAPAMLSIAMEKSREEGLGILYLMQDMRELELYSTVGTVVSVCDSLNYILEEEELLEVFKRVNNYLYPGGLFLFDFNTAYKYARLIGDATIAENRDECSFIWENAYDEKENINEYDVTVFVREENGLYRKFEETHYQKGYTLAEMKRLVGQAGLSWLGAVDADTHGMAKESSGRILVMAGERGKQP